MGLLHSHFPFFVRERLEQEWLARFGPDGVRQGGAILVSTQVVEQSVDLDADALFSESVKTFFGATHVRLFVVQSISTQTVTRSEGSLWAICI